VSGLQDSTKSNSAGVSLPLPAQILVPHRPPMLIIHQLLERNEDTALAESMVPTEGIFLDPRAGLLPEYFIELIAQSIATINGFDARKENRPPFTGYLVGIDNFSWIDRALPGETLQIRLKKTFEFQAVTIMEGKVIGPNGLVACGEIKVWEEKE
jgi:3-hydroxyacyl-[acyl-carrier-protein] dehydratase